MNIKTLPGRRAIGVGVLLLFSQLLFAADDQGFITAKEIQDRLQTAPDAMSKEVGRLVTGYRKQTPEVICAAVNLDSSQSSETIFEALNAGATRDQIPVSCECIKSDEGIRSLIQGALVNEVNAGDAASGCLPYLSKASAVKEAVTELLVAAEEWSYNYILSTGYDTLTEIGLDDGEDLLVDALVEGGILTFDGIDCGEACIRPVAETVVQNIIDVQDGVGIAGPLYGGQTVGSPDGPAEPSASSN